MRTEGRLAPLAYLALALLLAACQPQATPAPPAQPAATPATSPTPVASASPGPRVSAAPATTVVAASPTPAATTGTPVAGANATVTLNEDGQTVQMRVGDRFLLALGEGYDWTVEVADPSVLSRVIGVLTVRGSQGLYEAHKAGTTTLTATGDPPCRRAQPACAAPSRLFQVTVIVRP
jgi:hypothetical protein